MSDKPKRQRVQLDLDEKVVERLDFITGRVCGQVSRSTVLRDALGLLFRVVEETERGRQFGYRDKETGEFTGVVLLGMGIG